MLANSVREVGEDAFTQVRSLRSVRLSRELETIGPRAFFQSKAHKVVVPGSVRHIAERAFAEVSLVSLRFESENALAGLGENAFADAFIFHLFFPGSMRKIPSGILSGARQIWTVHIGEGTTELEDGCFAGLDVKKVHFPASLRKIGADAFSDCPGLWSVHVPSGAMRVS